MTLFIVQLSYRVPLERIDAALAEHGAFLERYFAAGHFLAAGRRVPRTGGVILAGGVDREALERILDEDPFRRDGLADYDVVAFTPTRTRADLRALLE